MTGIELRYPGQLFAALTTGPSRFGDFRKFFINLYLCKIALILSLQKLCCCGEINSKYYYAAPGFERGNREIRLLILRSAEVSDWSNWGTSSFLLHRTDLELIEGQPIKVPKVTARWYSRREIQAPKAAQSNLNEIITWLCKFRRKLLSR